MSIANNILTLLNEYRPNPKCELHYSTPFELLIAVILSAQCTDVRVNKCTEELFKKYNSPKSFANAHIEDIEKYVRECGLYKIKAQSLINVSRELIEKFDGLVPSTMEQLLQLSRVGRKTASVVLSEAFKMPAIAVDTHVFRVSRRLGLARGDSPEKVENELKCIYEMGQWSNLHLQLVLHGRYICRARNPSCSNCVVEKLCKKEFN
ncbi:MAG: endonuclease III [Christensenellaceae bacterium]|jgi:endonuclease-3|nr:endonuclease III [Christensenellaceae bacterium]